MRKRTVAFGIMGAAAFSIYLNNASWLAPQLDGQAKLYAHRGVHQPYEREGLTNETCTAARMLPPTHGLLENTIPSMAAAFEAGADRVEIDVYETKDGEWAVFHDFALDCRTDGTGRVRDHTMADLKELDVGYGYTADGGRTHPFRGRFVGAMPTLGEVLARFPEAEFHLHVKSGRARHAEALWSYLSALPDANLARLSLYATPRFDPAWEALGTGVPLLGGKHRMKACGKTYLLTGWTGRVPDACAGGIMVSVDLAPLFWGWPDRLQARFAGRPGGVTLIGPALKEDGSLAIDSLDELEGVPGEWSGWVYTNRPEVIGPALAPREID